MFKIRFPPTEIAHWAARYTFPGEDALVERVTPAARDRGYLKRREFLDLCRWKTPRTAKRCALNSSQQIRDPTQLSFNTSDAPAKMGIWPRFDGVARPTASV